MSLYSFAKVQNATINPALINSNLGNTMRHERTNFIDDLRAVGLLSAVLLLAAPAFTQDFRVESSMPRPVLENYLDRSISFTELLHDDLTQPRNRRGVDPRDNLRLILR